MTIKPMGRPATIGHALRHADEERAARGSAIPPYAGNDNLRLRHAASRMTRRTRRLALQLALTLLLAAGLVWLVATVAHWAAGR